MFYSNILNNIPSYIITAIFILIYIFIAIQRFPFIKIDRPAGVFTGVTLLILTGLITLQESYLFINFDVITFLLGMMIMVGYLQLSGFFHLAGYNIIKICDTPKKLLIGIIGISAILSALFVNDTICLLFTPIIIDATKRLKINPMPYLFSIIFASNIGSALTITGNPQNMYIGVLTSIPYLKFIMITAIPVALSLIILYFLIRVIYGKDMANFDKLLLIKSDIIIDYSLMIKTFIAIGITLILFIFHFSYPLASLIGATLIILLAGKKPSEVFTKVDWPILLLFAGLFIIMGAFEKAGYMENILLFLNDHIDEINLSNITIFSAVIIVLSNIVSNLPAVILLSPIALKMGSEFGGVLLALISTFAGNLTLVGSVATLIVLQIATGHKIKLLFWDHLKVGVLITFFSSGIAILSLYFIYFVFKS